jgi:hypothetical protein
MGEALRMRWIPATPTSFSRSTGFPSAAAVTAASSATGRSLVPAATTRTGPRTARARGVSGERWMVRAVAFHSAPGKASTSWAAVSSATRVARKPSPFSARREAMRSTCSVVFPCPKMTSG